MSETVRDSSYSREDEKKAIERLGPSKVYYEVEREGGTPVVRKFVVEDWEGSHERKISEIDVTEPESDLGRIAREEVRDDKASVED